MGKKCPPRRSLNGKAGRDHHQAVTHADEDRGDVEVQDLEGLAVEPERGTEECAVLPAAAQSTAVVAELEVRFGDTEGVARCSREAPQASKELPQAGGDSKGGV